jgi:RNA polymerase sigma-70 factor (ECF subfamily)
LKREEKDAFVVAVANQHGRRLRRFLLARVRNVADASDLAQEVFLRLLRVPNHESILTPEAYLFGLANHVIYEHRQKVSRRTEALDVSRTWAEIQMMPQDDPADRAETHQRVAELERALEQLSPKARAAVVLHRRDGYSIEEIGRQLGVSRPMAKKYLAQALSHVRRRLEGGAD